MVKPKKNPIPQAQVAEIIKRMCIVPMKDGKPIGPSKLEKVMLWTMRVMNARYGMTIAGLDAQDFFQQAVFELLQGNRHAYPIKAPVAATMSSLDQEEEEIRIAVFRTFRSLTHRAHRQRVFSSRFDEDIVDLDDLADADASDEFDPAVLLQLFKDQPEAKQVAQLLIEGLTRGQIAVQTGKSSDSIYQIISRKIKPTILKALETGYVEAVQA